MILDRRTFLAAIAAIAAETALPAGAFAADTSLLLSAARRGDGSHALFGVRPSGEIAFEVPLPGRGHAIAVGPERREAILVARRPGRFAVVVDLAGQVRQLLAAPDGRHFYGHAEFSADGRLLYTTENDYENERGAIGIWDRTDGYRRVGEIDSCGIGPHDLARLPGSDLLIVANGGILTHPDSGRAKLNLATMEPSVTLVDPRDGSLLRKGALAPELHKNGIRHITVGADGRAVFAMQYEGPVEDGVPLVGTVGRDGTLSLLETPRELAVGLKGYCADVAVDRAGRLAAASFPRGGKVGFWSLDDGRLLRLADIRDGAGIAAADTDGSFHLSNGFGALYKAAAMGVGPDRPFLRRSDLSWDNHLSLVSENGAG